MKLGYKAALDWLLDNDDTEFLSDCDPIASVSVCLVADIFGKDQNRVISDLQRRRDNRNVQG